MVAKSGSADSRALNLGPDPGESRLTAKPFSPSAAFSSRRSLTSREGLIVTRGNQGELDVFKQ